jgi:uncharacterized protein YjbJ (UPF0337 family)
MNKMQLRGSVRQFAGRVEEQTGKLLGNPRLQRLGFEKIAAAKVDRIVGDAAELIKAALRRH